MANWKRVTLALCSVGFFKEMRPSEPFLTPYLKEVPLNLTEEEINNQVFPVWTYSYLVTLIPVFLVTDILLYKPVIMFGCLSYISTWAILIWGRGLLTMQFMQFTYGLATATEIAYFSYIYAMVDAEHYQRVTGFTRMAILTGQFLAYFLGQLLISLSVTGYLVLNYVSFGSVCVALLLAIVLPKANHSAFLLQQIVERELQTPARFQHSGDLSSVQESFPNSFQQDSCGSVQRVKRNSHRESDNSITDTFYHIDDPMLHAHSNSHMYHDIDTSSLGYSFGDMYSESSGEERQEEDNSETQQTEEDQTAVKRSFSDCWKIFRLTLSSLWREFSETYSNQYLLIWSIWWAVATCGNLQVGNYIQNLWDTVSPHRDSAHTYNGGVEAVSTFLGALSALSVSYIPANWRLYGELLLGIASMGSCVLLIIMAQADNIWVAYVFYAIFRATYQLVITVATFQIAGQLSVQKYGLVFGFNTFLALSLDAIITGILVDKRGLDSKVTIQFTVYGGYFGIMGLLFLAKAIYNFVQHHQVTVVCCQRQDEDDQSTLVN